MSPSSNIQSSPTASITKIYILPSTSTYLIKSDFDNTVKAINTNHDNTTKYINRNSNAMFEKLFDKSNNQDIKLDKQYEKLEEQDETL